MVDVMAPVLDHLNEEGGTPLRSRRRNLWLGDVRDTEGGRGVKSGRSSRKQDHRRRSPRLSILNGRGDNNNDDDDGSSRRIKATERERTRLNEGGEGNRDGDGNETDDEGRPEQSAKALETRPLTASSIAPSTAPAVLPRPSELSSLTPLPSPISISTLQPLPTPSANAPVAVNPAASVAPVVTLSSMTTMTITSSLSMPLTRSQQSFIPTIFPSSTAPSTSATAVFDNAPPTPTIFISSTGDPFDGDGDRHRDDRGPPPGGLSPTAEDVLISAGSIGNIFALSLLVLSYLQLANGYRQYRSFYSHLLRKLDGLADVQETQESEKWHGWR